MWGGDGTDGLLPPKYFSDSFFGEWSEFQDDFHDDSPYPSIVGAH